MIKFKHTYLAEEFEKLDYRLQVQTYALAGFMEHKHGKDIMIVSCIRMEDMVSLHYWLCALDFRIQQDDLDPIYSDEEITDMKFFCNHFIYDDNRPRKKALFIHANRSSKGKHGHLQCFPSSDTTRIRK